jgi:hypothetical protein
MLSTDRYIGINSRVDRMARRLEDVYQKGLFGHVPDGLPSHDKTGKELAYLSSGGATGATH